MVIIKVVRSRLVGLYRLLRFGFPSVQNSGAKWGLLQTLLSIVFFLFGVPVMLIFLQPDRGRIMSILIIVFFTLGFLVLSYTGWLGLKFYGHSKTQKDTPQQLEDLEKTLVKEIKKSGNKLGKKIDGLVDEIRQDRNERNKPTE